MILRRSFLAVLSVCAVLPVLVIAYASTQVIAGFQGTFSAQESAECAIVFGAAVHGTVTPGPGILRRVQAASELYHDGRVTRLILSGGRGSGDQRSEAAVMFDVARSLDIATGAIILEDQSRSTWENIAFTKSFLQDCDSVVGVSDRYHLARISLIAGKQGITLDTYPAAAAPSVVFEWRNVLREIAGYVVYLLGYQA